MAKNGKRNGFVRARTGDLLGVSEARYQLRHETIAWDETALVASMFDSNNFSSCCDLLCPYLTLYGSVLQGFCVVQQLPVQLVSDLHPLKWKFDCLTACLPPTIDLMFSVYLTYNSILCSPYYSTQCLSTSVSSKDEPQPGS